jgi:uncharacterized repeat protein (TIGR03803 family)
LYTFTGGSDGGNPVDVGSLVRDSAGNLYGTTEYEGSCGEGTVFQLSNDGIETVLHSFCGADGSSPIASVIRDSSGDFYGTTIGGGSIGCGTTFKLSGSTLTTLHSFTCGGDGGSPLGVVLDKSGNLYGVANLGGTNNNGLVYEISSSGQFSVIYTFCSVAGCADGASPARGLVMDTAGSIYGTTVNGGAPSCVFGCGTVFKLSEGGNSWTETVLHTFTGRDGQYPVEITVSYQVNAGRRQLRLFGTTGEGGSGGDGTVFEMSQSKSGFKLTTIHNFTGNNGEYPYGELSLVKGKLFGTTNFAGSGGFGTVFRLTQTNRGWTADTLYSFTDGADGGEPEGGVIADPAGNLYGTAPFGGNTACYPTGCGVVFEITP